VGRILGLDYGKKRIGVAVSDPMEITAQPVETWSDLTDKELVDKLLSFIEDMGVERIVIGFPLTLKGEKGFSAQMVERFVKKCSNRISIPITLWDERLTSVEAEYTLRKMKIKPSRRKGKVDLIASVLLLQNYLDYKKGS
jgi:putative Holliday junction resolvase